jgi:hypothetical protein
MVGWNLNPDAVFLDQLARLAHAELALVRIDADKRDQHVEFSAATSSIS